MKPVVNTFYGITRLIERLNRLESYATSPQEFCYIKAAIEAIRDNQEIEDNVPQALSRAAKLLQKDLNNWSQFTGDTSEGQTSLQKFSSEAHVVLLQRIEQCANFIRLINTPKPEKQQSDASLSLLEIYALGIAALRRVNIDTYAVMKKELISELISLRDLIGEETFNLACFLLKENELNKILLAMSPDNTSTIKDIIIRLIKMDNGDRSFILDNFPLVITAIENGISIEELLSIKRHETLRKYLFNDWKLPVQSQRYYTKIDET
jgi:hypothetical protein